MIGLMKKLNVYLYACLCSKNVSLGRIKMFLVVRNFVLKNCVIRLYKDVHSSYTFWKYYKDLIVCH